MAYERTDDTSPLDDDDVHSVTFRPKEKHSWLKEIVVSTYKGETHIFIITHLQDMKESLNTEQQEKITRESEKLVAIRTLCEMEFTLNDKTRDFINKFKRKLDKSDTMEGCLAFKAGPTSKIRDALQQIERQIGLPSDIKLAVVDYLQNIWQKTAG